MEGALERYEKMGLRDSFAVPYRYPIACKELSAILRLSYTDFPKPLQSLLFHDAIAAFHLLPQMQMQSAVSTANNLIQSIEAELPKQKRVMAVKEFKQAMVAHKRRNKCQQEDKEMIELPQDILLHLFSFLDMQSLVSAGMVCRSWNAAANDNCIWQVHYFTYFEYLHTVSKDEFNLSSIGLKDHKHSATSNAVDDTLSSFKYAFRRKYEVSRLMRFKHNRGYCGHCNSIVWLTNLKCPNTHVGSRSGNQHLIKPILSPKQLHIKTACFLKPWFVVAELHRYYTVSSPAPSFTTVTLLRPPVCLALRLTSTEGTVVACRISSKAPLKFLCLISISDHSP